MINRANIIITNNCNLKCKHCYLSATICKEDYETNYIKAKKMLDKLNQSNIKNVMFTGGECMLFPYLKELIQYAKKLDMTVTIFTNGMIYSEEIFDLVDFVNISLDGPKMIHNEIRGNAKSYDNIIKVLGYLKKIDKYTTLQVTVNSKNVKELDFLAELTLNHLNVRTVKFVFVSNEGRAKENNIYHTEEDIEYLFDRLEFLYENSKYHIQFVPNVIKKYDFENYYLSNNLSFPVWIDINKNIYYVLNENFIKNNDLNSFDLNKAQKKSDEIIQMLCDNKDKIKKRKYIDVEEIVLEFFKGE